MAIISLQENCRPTDLLNKIIVKSHPHRVTNPKIYRSCSVIQVIIKLFLAKASLKFCPNLQHAWLPRGSQARCSQSRCIVAFQATDMLASRRVSFCQFVFSLVSSSFIIVYCTMYTCAPAFQNGFTVRPKVWTGLAIHPSETMLPASARRCLPCGSVVVSQLAVARTWDAICPSGLDDAFFNDLLFSTGWFVG